MERNIFHCEACGGIMEFDVKTQTLKCPNCETSIEIEHDSDKIVEHPLTLDATRRCRVEEKETSTLNCNGCGASIEVTQFDAAISCPYCGSDYVLSNQQEDTLIPDGVIPFKIDKRELTKLFRQWIKKRWFAPNKLKKLYQHGGFCGIYAPYWTFDGEADCPYTGEGGIRRTVHYKDSEGKDRTRIETDWYDTRGRIEHFFDDIQIPATNKFKKGLFSGIEPFNFNGLVSYSPDYLSGYLAENYSIDLDTGHSEAREEMKDQLRQMAEREIERRYDTSRSIGISPRFDRETYKYLLVPIYSTTYSFKHKTYTVVINGQDGTIKGEYPKSALKIIVLILFIIIICVLIYMMMM